MLHEPLFTIFGRGVHMYGICIATGLIACLIAFYTLSKKKGMPTEVQDYVFFVLIGGLAIGFFSAMLFQAFYNWLDKGTFDLFGSGMTVMGGLLGGAGSFLLLYFLIGKYYFKGKKKDLHKKHFNTLLRVAPICIVIAHAFGRIGCLMAGCCHGQYLGKEYVFGGIWMRGTRGVTGYYVPTQLYEALFLFALGGVMTLLLFKRCNINIAIYLIAYGIWRFIIEFMRADYRGGADISLSPSQIQSFLFVAGGIAIILFYKFRKIPLFFSKNNVEESIAFDRQNKFVVNLVSNEENNKTNEKDVSTSQNQDKKSE